MAARSGSAVLSFASASAAAVAAAAFAAVSDAVVKIRANVMGKLIPTGLDAPVRLLRELEAGRPVAMLVDQFYYKGVDVIFFGRRAKANPLRNTTQPGEVELTAPVT